MTLTCLLPAPGGQQGQAGRLGSSLLLFHSQSAAHLEPAGQGTLRQIELAEPAVLTKGVEKDGLLLLVQAKQNLDDGLGVAAVAAQQGPGLTGLGTVVHRHTAVCIAGGQVKATGLEQALADGTLAVGECAARDGLEVLVKDVKVPFPGRKLDNYRQ